MFIQKDGIMFRGITMKDRIKTEVTQFAHWILEKHYVENDEDAVTAVFARILPGLVLGRISIGIPEWKQQNIFRGFRERSHHVIYGTKNLR